MTVGKSNKLLRGAAALFFPVFFGAALLLFPDVSTTAAREGVALCLQTVLPSLFPFFVLSSLLVQSDVPRLLSRAMAGVMYPLFGVSGAGASALILGLLGGYRAYERRTKIIRAAKKREPAKRSALLYQIS